MLKKYSYILIFLLLLGTSSVAFAETKTNSLVDNAINFVSDVGLTAIFKGISAINFLIGYIAGIMVFIGGNLANWALNLNSTIIQSPTVQVGWVITRDLANLGFVLAIILIAFATILRVESYEMKRTLWKLIVAALLINFSLVIAGVFIDFSGVLTEFFISKATRGDLSKMGDAFANAFQVQKFLQATKDANAIDKLVAGLSGISIVPFAASLFFVALFTIVAAIGLFGLAAMLFIRYIMLSILLILMPLAWLMWIWPELEGKWKEWWSQFFTWVWFAPVVSFFIYLALNLASSKYQGQLAVGGFDSLGLIIDNVGQIVGQMAAVLGILFGGLIMAQRMGIYGADVTLGFANQAKGWFQDRARGAFRYSPPGLLARGAAGAATAGGEKLATGANELARRAISAVGRIPGVGQGLEGRLEGMSLRLKEREQKQIEDLQKQFAEGAQSDRLTKLESTYNPIERAALINAIAEKGEIKNAKAYLTKRYGSSQRADEMFNSFARESIQRGGKGAKALLSKDPMLASLGLKRSDFTTDSSFERAKTEAVEKAFEKMDPEAIDSINLDLLKNPDLLSRLKPSHLKRFSTERSFEDQDKLIKLIEGELSVPPQDDPEAQRIRTRIVQLAKAINKSPAMVQNVNADLIKGVASARTERPSPSGTRSSTEPVPGLNIQPPPPQA